MKESRNKKQDQNQEFEDEFEELEEDQFEEKSWMQQNSNLITIGSIAVIAILAVIYIFGFGGNETEREASLKLSRVVPLYLRGDYESALNGNPQQMIRGQSVVGLKKIASDYSDTPSGKLASLLAGKASIRLDQKAQADNYLDNATDSESDLVRRAAFANLAKYHELQGNLDKAAENYEKAATVSKKIPASHRYNYYAALCFEKAGKKDQAKEIYQNLSTIEGFSEFKVKAKAGLARLGMVLE